MDPRQLQDLEVSEKECARMCRLAGKYPKQEGQRRDKVQPKAQRAQSLPEDHGQRQVLAPCGDVANRCDEGEEEAQDKDYIHKDLRSLHARAAQKPVIDVIEGQGDRREHSGPGGANHAELVQPDSQWRQEVDHPEGRGGPFFLKYREVRALNERCRKAVISGLSLRMASASARFSCGCLAVALEGTTLPSSEQSVDTVQDL
mmetsp:Transcript_19107/g.40625  ORF Transcript_19107/g.40625 Transcript_19107/m.40625 type:complete len:202 (-) Transcript_19107:578-1183(-)